MNTDAPGPDSLPDAKRGRGALANRPLVRAVLVLFSGDALGQVMLVMIAPIITRIYSPEEFGVATAYSAALAVVVVLSALRYEFAIPVPADDEEAANVLGAGLLSAAGMALVGVVAYLGLAAIVEVVGDGLPPSVAFLFGLSVLLNGCLAALGGWMIRCQSYDILARSRIARNVSQAILQLTLGWAGWGALGLIVAAVIGTTVGLAHLMLSFLRNDRARLSAIEWTGVRTALGRYRRFPLLSGTAAFVQTVNVEIPYVVFGGLYARADVGAMGLARRTPRRPVVHDQPSSRAGVLRARRRAGPGNTSESARLRSANDARHVGHLVPLGIIFFVLVPPLTTALIRWRMGRRR